MTLCLAWKQGENIYFASDSRLMSSEETILTDYASKIFKVGVEIYKDLPELFSGLPKKPIHQTTYGLCFSGSYLNGSILANTIDSFLSNILVVPYSDISIDNLSNIAFTIYKQVSQQLMQTSNENGLSQVLFGGYCLQTNDFKLYKFFPKDIEYGQVLEFGKEEINLNSQTILLGDAPAKLKAEELLEKVDAEYTHYHLLREIIQDTTFKTVGGNIQVGCFQPSKFRTHGFTEPSSYRDNDGYLQIEETYILSGLKLDFKDINNELFSGKIYPNELFFSPFQKEKMELIQQQGQK